MPFTSVFQFPRPCWCVCVCASHRCSSCVWCVCVLSSGRAGCERSPCGSCVWSPRSPRSLDGDKTTRAQSDVTRSPLTTPFIIIPRSLSNTHTKTPKHTHTLSSLRDKVCVCVCDGFFFWEAWMLLVNIMAIYLCGRLFFCTRWTKKKVKTFKLLLWGPWISTQNASMTDRLTDCENRGMFTCCSELFITDVFIKSLTIRAQAKRGYY